MITLEMVKFHLRIDGNAEDTYLQMLLDSATNYVTEITGVENEPFAPSEYVLLCLLFVASWYENRASTSERAMHEHPHGATMLINFLKPGASHV